MMDRDAILNIGMEMLAGGASLEDVVAAAANYGVNLYDVYYSDPGATFEVTTPAPVDTTPPPQEPIYVDPGPVYVDPGPVYEESPPAGGLSVVTPLAPPVVTAQTPVEQPPVVTGGLSTALPPTTVKEEPPGALGVLSSAPTAASAQASPQPLTDAQLIAIGQAQRDAQTGDYLTPEQGAALAAKIESIAGRPISTQENVDAFFAYENKPDVTPAATDLPVASSASTNTASLLPGEPYPGYFAEQAALQAAAATTQQQQARDQATGLQQFQQQATQQSTSQGGLSTLSPVVTDVRGPTTSPPVEETRNQWGDLPYDPTLTDTVSTTTDVVKPPTDMEIAQQMAAGIIPANMLYDVNKDGQVTSADALLIGQGTPVRTLQELLTTAGSPLVSADTAGGVTSADTITGATGNDAVKPTTPPPTSSLLSGVDKYIDPISGKDETQLLKQLLDKQLKEQGITNLDQLSLENISEGLEDFVNSPQTRTALINKTTGAEVNPVLFDDGYGTKFVVTPNGIEKQFVAAEKVAKQAASILDPNSTGGAWTTQAGESSGPGFGAQGMLNQIGQRIVERTGITDLSQLGARQVPVEGYYRTVSGGEGGDVSEYVPASTKTEFFDKATGQTIDWDGSLGTWGQGPGTTYGNVTADAEGKLKVETLGDDSTDPFIKAVAKAGPVLNIANVLTGGALTPLTLAVNSINAVANENPFAIAASFAGLGGYTGLIDTATASAIQAGANAANAVKEGNLLGALATIAGSSLGQGIGTADLGNGITVADALNAASAVDKAGKGDIAGALADAGKAANSTEVKTAGAALQLVNALESGNLNAIANAAQGLYSGVNNLVTQSQVGQLLVDSAGIGAIDADLGGDLLGTGALSTLKTDTVTGGLSGAADTAGGGSAVDNVVRGGLPGGTDTVGSAATKDAIQDLIEPPSVESQQAMQQRVANDVATRYSKLDPEFGTPALSRDVAVKELEAAGFKTEQANDILDGVERQVAAARTAALDTAAQNLAAINAGAGEFAGADQRAAVAAGAGEFAGADKAAAVNTRIANAASFNDAYAIARQEFGPNATFNYQGKLYSTASAEERPDLSGAKPTTATQVTTETPYVAPNGMHNRAAFIQAGGGTSDADYAKYVNAVNAVISQGQSGTLIKPSSVNSEGKDLPSTTGPVTVGPQSALGNAALQGISTAFGMGAEAAGNTLKAFGTMGEALGLNTAQMSDFGRKLENIAQEMYPQALTTSENEVKARFASASSGKDLGMAIVDSVINNPGAVLKMVGVEGIQEIPNIALALATGGAYGAVRYAGLLAGLGLDVIESAGLQGAQKVDEGLAKGLSRTASVKAAVDDMKAAGAVTALMTAAADKIPFGGTVAKTLIKGSATEGAEEYVIARATGADHMGALRQAAFGALIGGPTEASLQSAGNLTSVVINGNAMVGTYADGTKVTITEPEGATELKIDVAAPSAVASNVTSTLTSDLTSGVDLNTAINNTVTANINADLTGTIDSTVKVLIDNGADLTQGVSDLTSAAASATGDTTKVIDQVVGSLATNNVDLNANAGSVVAGAVAGGASVDAAVTDTLTAITNNGGTTNGAATPIIDAVSKQTGGDTGAVTDAASTIIASSGGDQATTTTVITAAANGTDGNTDVVGKLVGDATKTGNAGTTAAAVDAAITATNGGALNSSVTAALDNGADASLVLSTTSNTLINNGMSATDAATQTLDVATSNGVDTDTAITSTVSGALAAGGTTAEVLPAVVDTSIKSGGDTGAVIKATVDAGIKSGGDTTEVASSVVDSGIKAGGDITVVVGGAIDAGIKAGGSTTEVVGGAVGAGIAAGGDTTDVVSAAVTSGITAGADTAEVVTSTIDSGIKAGGDTTAIVTATVDTSIKTGGDAAEVVTTAIETAITAGGDTTSSVSGAVSGATNAGTATDTAVSSAIDGAIKAGGSSTEATSAAVSTTIIDAVVTGGDTSSTITKAVEGAVGSSMDGGTALIISADSALSTGAAIGLDTETLVASVITGAVNGGTDSATAISSTVSVAISQGTDINTAIDAAQQTDTKATITIDNNGTVTTQTDATTSTVSIDTTTGITSTVTINNNTNSAVITEVDTKSGVTTETTINNDGTVTTDTTLHVVPPEDKTTGTTTSPPTGTTTGTTTSPTPTVPEGTTPTVTTTAPTVTTTTPTVTTTTPATTPTATQPAKSSSAGMMIPGMITGAKLANDWLGGKLLASQTREKYLGPLAQYFAEVQDLPPAPETVEEEMRLPYYTYGQEPSLDQIFGEIPIGAPEESEEEPVYRAGGSVMNPQFMYAQGGLSRQDFREGKHVSGPGDGQSDDIPAMLADGEFVFPSDVVSALGNGSTKAGTEKLYEMMHAIRQRARSKGPKDLPPPAFKSPLDYLKKR